jgi:microcystin degradation protein MlrC
MRVLVAGFQHETNTFAPSPTGYDDFVRGGAFPAMVRGADLLTLRNVNIPVGGFLHALPEAQPIPVIWAGATPAAHVKQDAYERIAGEILAAARLNNFDAVYLDLHGAMVCSHEDDGEGRLLLELRHILGPRIPIVASLDLHANVTDRMMRNADALVAYRTYSHEDMAEAGERAAGLLRQLMRRGEPFVRAVRCLPFLIPINAMCTLMEPAKSIYAELNRAERAENLALSFAPGFPAADFPECGGTVWGYGANGRIAAAVEALTRQVTAREADWVVPLLSPHEAVREAMRLSAGAARPVIIADTQDNPGGGGDSNTTGILHALVACKAQGAALGLMVDPAAAQAAHQAGAGRDITIALGGQSGDDPPLKASFHVEQLSDGCCRYDGPMMHGKLSNVGPTARLSLGGTQIVVSSFKDQMLDRNLYRMAGVEPERMKILVNKSSVHFRADFEPIAEAVLVAKAPGPLRADPADFPWTRLKPGLRLRPLGPAFMPV